MLFKKNVQMSELANKLIHMDVQLNDKLNDIELNITNKLTDQLTNKLTEQLNEQLNDKLDKIQLNITNKLNEITVEIREQLNKQLNEQSNEQLNEKINRILNNQIEQSLKTDDKLKSITSIIENSTNKNNKELKNNILETKQELLQTWKTSDLSLRTDLQTFLLGLQKDIIHNICSQTNLAIEQTKELKSSILLINEQVNKFYYDNELIKHQLLLEQDIRNYNDEIESIKLTANNLKNTIDDILKNYDFEN